MTPTHLDLIARDLIALAEAMPEEAYGFRPEGAGFAGARTFGEQVKHTATVVFITAAIVRGERSPYPPGPNDNGRQSIQGKASILAYLREAFDYARGAIESLADPARPSIVETWFGPQRRDEVAAGIVYHSYNHYGQMAVYARMQGIVPPASRANLP